MPAEIAVTVAAPGDLPDLVRFFRAIEHPDDSAAADGGETHLQRSLAAFDFLRSDSCWLLLARAGQEPVGYLLAVRVPKADERVGFLFVDEIYVRPAYRRQGVARALLAQVQALAGDLDLTGVRLLVRSGNGPARSLYHRCGFAEHETILCQWQRDKQ